MYKQITTQQALPNPFLSVEHIQCVVPICFFFQKIFSISMFHIYLFQQGLKQKQRAFDISRKIPVFWCIAFMRMVLKRLGTPGKSGL